MIEYFNHQYQDSSYAQPSTIWLVLIVGPVWLAITVNNRLGCILSVITELACISDIDCVLLLRHWSWSSTLIFSNSELGSAACWTFCWHSALMLPVSFPTTCAPLNGDKFRFGVLLLWFLCCGKQFYFSLQNFKMFFVHLQNLIKCYKPPNHT